ncbi:MAG: COP23 domain-containing protein [Cyanobacteria bacterium J06600_6]
MKPNLFAQTLTGLAIAFGAIAVSAQSSQAQSRFSCDVSQMSTTVNTERGSIPLIRWADRSFPPPFTPEQRCQIVSNRFKKFDENGTLKYIKADIINNLPALCVAAYKGGSCLPDGLLVTFKPGTDANQTLLKILDRRVWAASGPIQLSSGGNDLVSQADGNTYINMEAFFDWANEPQ